MKNQIPKIINYCWFGKTKKNRLIKKCIKSWKKYCPDYEIIEWNEENFDINSNLYVKQAYDNKKWAFVSDYVRLYAIYSNGGIYLDTDVELIKSLNDLLQYDAFFSSENNENINTGLGFGAKKNNKIVKLLLDSYDDICFQDPKTSKLDLTPCTHRNTETLNKVFGDVSLKMNDYLEKQIILLGKEYFCPFNSKTGEMKKTKNTIGIHWFNASWRSKKINVREKILRPIKRIIGVEKFNKFKRKKR